MFTPHLRTELANMFRIPHHKTYTGTHNQALYFIGYCYPISPIASSLRKQEFAHPAILLPFTQI